MDMSGRTAFRSMHDQQLLVRVDAHPRNAIALRTVADGERVAVQDVREQSEGLIATLWNVHPDQGVVPFEKRLDSGHIVRLDLVARKRQHPHAVHVPTLDRKSLAALCLFRKRSPKGAVSDRASTLCRQN